MSTRQILFRNQFCLLLSAMLVICVVFSPAIAETRLALIVGNSHYKHPPLPQLPNPVNDGRLVQQKLQSIGFEVDYIEDADLGELKRHLTMFGRTIEKNGPDTIALIYYAGHGVQDDHQINYIIP